MRRFCSVIAVLTSTAVFAVPKHYRINSQLFIDGKLVSSPQVIANAGEPAEIMQVSENPHKEVKMKVVATSLSNENIRDGILLKFDVEYISGSRTVKSSPQILAKSGS